MTALETARLYFELSNQRDLARIETMFLPEATYSSDNQGLFWKRTEIMSMMRAFFCAYRELHWTIEEAREDKPGIAEIRFRFRGVDGDGQPCERQGLERVVAEAGTIRHIEVRNL